MLRTPLCDLLGIEVPIIQAPIGSASCPALAAAVSNAGGLGMLAMSWRDPDAIRSLIRETKQLTAHPFGINLVLEWPQAERLAVCLEEGVRVISLSWGNPELYCPMIDDANAVVLHTVGSAKEAADAASKGVDAVVAQGWESGGHVLSEVSTLALVPAVVDAVGRTPVIAAGGIVDGRGVAAALVLGAQGVWIGTRFLASEEAAIHPRYRSRLLEAAEADTVYTKLFDGGWPGAPHRVLRNDVVESWQAAGQPPSGSRPGEGEVVARYGDGDAIVRYSDSLPRPDVTGDIDAMAMYAGQGVGLVRDVKPASEIVGQLVAEAERVLAMLGKP